MLTENFLSPSISSREAFHDSQNRSLVQCINGGFRELPSFLFSPLFCTRARPSEDWMSLAWWKPGEAGGFWQPPASRAAAEPGRDTAPICQSRPCMAAQVWGGMMPTTQLTPTPAPWKEPAPRQRSHASSGTIKLLTQKVDFWASLKALPAHWAQVKPGRKRTEAKL